jgi:hypothetical protein
MRNSPSPGSRPPAPQQSSARGWVRGLTIILVIAMIGLLSVGLWALSKNDFGMAFASLLSGAAVTFLLLVITLFALRRRRP